MNAESRYNASASITLMGLDGEPLGPAFADIVPRFTDVNRQSNRLYRINSGDDWHLLAHRFYGNGLDFWAILDFNEVLDPFDELEIGRRIVIPSNDTVQFDVKNFEHVADIVEGPE